MYLKNIMELVAFVLLLHDACKGKAKLISTQMVFALTVGVISSFLNLPKNRVRRLTKLTLVFLTSCAAAAATWKVAQSNEVKGEDILAPRLPKWMNRISIYVATIVFGLLSLFMVCDFQVPTLVSFVSAHFQSTVTTFENYLHALSLLPQLVLCRRQGFVCPTAARFLFIIGLKYIYEFATDAWVSYARYLKGKFSFHEISFMSGDLFAAIILMDFLYLVIKQRKKGILFGASTLDLPEDGETKAS